MTIYLVAGLAILGLLFWRRGPGIGSRSFRSALFDYLLAGMALSLTVCLVLYPDLAFESAVKGLKIWWEVVFPALLPFFIGSEILMGLGVVHFMGVLLEPFMRPLFRVPGVGSFVMAMGLASGYPIGSILTAKLRRRNLVTKVEAERLMSFTNTADPLFMTGAVAVGMFGRAELGLVIMAAHYSSSLLLGLLLRFYRPGAPATRLEEHSRENVLIRGLKKLREERRHDGRPFGQLMGDAVRNSVNTLLMVGGFIILFSVLIRIMSEVGLVTFIAAGFSYLLAPLGIDLSVVEAMISGLFEISLGTQLAGSVDAPLAHRLIVASSIIAWSGLSVHAQVAAVTQDTDISIAPFIGARLIHAVLAGAITAFLVAGPMPVMAALPTVLQTGPMTGPMSWGPAWYYYGLNLALTALLFILLPLLLHLVKGIRVLVLRIDR